MEGGGGVVTFEVEGGKAAAFRFANALQLIDISNNLGDAKSLDHPSRHHHPPAADAGGARRAGHHRGHVATVGRAWKTRPICAKTSAQALQSV